MALQFCIICIIILFAGNATAVFEIEVLNQETVEGVRDGSLTLKWMFKNIKEDYIIFSSNLYFNVVNASTTAVICNWNTSSQTPTVSAIGQQKFGTRISVSYATFIYTFTITNLKYEDAGPYLLEAGVSPGGIIGIQGSSSIIIISKVIGTDNKRTKESSGGKKSNTGAIVGGVIGGILFLILAGVGVFFFLRWKKNKGPGHRDGSGKKLTSGYGTNYEAPQYADTSLAMNKTESKEPPSAQMYMDLGPGGGRVGERTNPPPKSHYREVKNQEDDAPPKPKRGIMRQDSDGNTISDDVNV